MKVTQATGANAPDKQTLTVDPIAPGGGLESLALEAENLDALSEFGPPVVLPAGPTLGQANTKLLGPLFVTIRESACALSGLVSPRVTFTDAKAGELAGIWGECAAHYGLDLAAMGGKWGPLAGAVFATFGVISPTVTAARAEMQANGNRKPEPGQGAAAAGAVPMPTGAVHATFTPGVIQPAFGRA